MVEPLFQGTNVRRNGIAALHPHQHAGMAGLQVLYWDRYTGGALGCRHRAGVLVEVCSIKDFHCRLCRCSDGGNAAAEQESQT